MEETQAYIASLERIVTALANQQTRSKKEIIKEIRELRRVQERTKNMLQHLTVKTVTTTTFGDTKPLLESLPLTQPPLTPHTDPRIPIQDLNPSQQEPTSLQQNTKPTQSKCGDTQEYDPSISGSGLQQTPSTMEVICHKRTSCRCVHYLNISQSLYLFIVP